MLTKTIDPFTNRTIRIDKVYLYNVARGAGQNVPSTGSYAECQYSLDLVESVMGLSYPQHPGTSLRQNTFWHLVGG
jgi:hypothetical protein